MHRVLLPSNRVSFDQIRLRLETPSLANPPDVPKVSGPTPTVLAVSLRDE